MVKKTVFFIIVFCTSFLGFTQNQSDQLFKEYNETAYWMALRAEYYLKSQSFFYFESNSKYHNEPVLGASFPLNQMYRLHHQIGFEYKAADKWYLGGSGKLVHTAGLNRFFTKINISHIGDIGSLKLLKEISFEHIKFLVKNDNPNVRIDNNGRVGIGLILLKEYKVHQKPLQALLGYRAFQIFDFRKDGFSAYDSRLIDKTRFFTSVNYQIANQLNIGLFAMRETDYSYRLAQFDINMQPLVEEGKLNRITPTFGFLCTYYINKQENYSIINRARL